MKFNPQPKTYTPPKEKTGLKKVRTDDTGKLRRELDTVFAKYIRSLSKNCYTCNQPRAEHCGHFIRRGNDATRWDQDNARPQCWNCNILLEGNLDRFREKLIKEIGISKVEDIEQRARIAVKFSKDELVEMINKYKTGKAA